jgi:hypothetical protein
VILRGMASDRVDASEVGASMLGLLRDQRAMAAWVEAHPRKDLARARSADLRPYGLDVDAVREVFAEYVAAFDVDCDGI